MTSISIDIKDGLSSSTAIKGPCRVATTANIALVGEQTIDGVAVVTGDRVLVKNQTTASDNGIWICDTGNWRRSKDFNKTKDVVKGTQILVTSGTLYASSGWYLSSADPISIGSTNLTFTQNILLNAAQLIALEAAAAASASAADVSEAAAQDAAAAAAASAASVSLPSPAVANTFLQRNAGNTAYVAKTGTEVRDYIQANKPYNVLWAGADPTNTTDSRAAFVAAEANGSIYIPDGSYKIATNWTPAVPVKISDNAKLYIADGVTVSFASATEEIGTPNKQRFYFPGTGTGAVTNLDFAHAGWFAGDKLNTTTNALTDLQKWADSVVTNGTLYQSSGFYTSDGSAYIECTKTQRVVGTSRNNSLIRFSGTATRWYRFSTASAFHFVSDIGFTRLTPFAAPTIGATILFDAGARGFADSISTSGCYDGVQTTTGWAFGQRLVMSDSRHCGVNISGGNESHFSDSIIAANSSWITLTGVTGSFTNGETVTFTGGSGTIFVDGSLNYKAIFTSTQPTIGLVLTGSTSGATGTLATRINGHQAGGIRVYGACQASLFESMEVSGGDYGLLMDSTGNTASTRNLTTVFTGCLFDSAIIAGALVKNSAGTKFLGCWFSSWPGANGLYLEETISTTVTDCEWTTVGLRCILCSTNALDTQISGGIMADVNGGNTANLPAVQFASGTTGFIRDTYIGKSLGYGSNNPYRGIQVDSGAVAISIDNVDVSSCTTGIVDNSTGTTIRNVKGAKTANQGTDTVASGTSSKAVTHGLAFTPAVSDIQITPNGLLSAATLTGYYVSAVSSTTFTVTVNANAAANWSFGWSARVKGA